MNLLNDPILILYFINSDAIVLKPCFTAFYWQWLDRGMKISLFLYMGHGVILLYKTVSFVIIPVVAPLLEKKALVTFTSRQRTPIDMKIFLL